MRLAFSVAINVDADILLIDEILAVGDSAFQTKCFNKLKSLKDAGTTIVIVSHSLGQIEKLCDRVIWLENGVIKKEGPARQICREYLDSMEMARLERAEQEYRMQMEEEKRKEQETAKQKEEEKRLSEEAAKELQKREEEKRRNASCRQISSQCGPDARREGTGEIHFTSVRMLDGKRRETLLYKTGDALLIEMQYESKLIDEDINFIIGITRNDWVYCYGATVKQSTGNYVKSQSQGKILRCV